MFTLLTIRGISQIWNELISTHAPVKPVQEAVAKHRR